MNKMQIPYKPEPSEFEIQAYLYMRLKEIGVNVRGCVPGPRKRDRGRFPRMVFDLVIFNSYDVPQVIIEVKDSPRHRRGTHQDYKYRSTGYPVIYIKSLKDADKFIETRRSLVKQKVQT